MDSRNLLCGHCGPRIATLSCERCGMPLCSECLVEGRCPACARDLAHRRSRRRRLIWTLAAGFVPGLIMASVAGTVLVRYSRHHCHVSRLLHLRQARSRGDLGAQIDKRIEKQLAKQMTQIGAVRPADDPVPVTMDRDLTSPVIRAGPGRYVVDRGGVARILNNRQVRVVPVQRDGRPLGFKLYQIRAGSSYHRLGLRNGDIIQRINGIVVSSPEKALGAYNRIRNASRVTLRVLRQGKPRTLRYWITEA